MVYLWGRCLVDINVVSMTLSSLLCELWYYHDMVHVKVQREGSYDVVSCVSRLVFPIRYLCFIE